MWQRLESAETREREREIQNSEQHKKVRSTPKFSDSQNQPTSEGIKFFNFPTPGPTVPALNFVILTCHNASMTRSSHLGDHVIKRYVANPHFTS